MRQVVYGCGISLDGYLARPNGSVDWLDDVPSPDPSAFFETIDVGVMGRKTFEVGLKLGGEEQFKSKTITYYVFSRSAAQKESDLVKWTDSDPIDLIASIRKSPGKNIFFMGGGELARAFLEADLVDRIEVGIVPILLGEGIPMFPAGFPERRFKLVESLSHPGGLITASYERVH